MGEEVQMSDYEGCDSFDSGEEDRVLEWEVGLPSAGDLTPLSQPLIPPELASAFSITPEPCRSMLDVNRASQNTVSSLRRQNQTFSSNNLKTLPSFSEDRHRDPSVVEGDEPGNSMKDGTESRKGRRLDTEEADSALPPENSTDDPSARTPKRPRLVWTPQLHKRFVDVVAHLGIKSAVPKTIMQLMNVEGLTRENVASHLQKYRLYLKRMQGLSNEGPSPSDHLFASTPVPQSLHEPNGHMPVPMPYAAAPMLPMPVLGMAHGHSNMSMVPVNNPGPAYHGFESHPYSMYRDQQRDWSSGNKLGSFVSSRVTPNDK